VAIKLHIIVVHIYTWNYLKLDEFLECMLHKTDTCDDAADYMLSDNLHGFIYHDGQHTLHHVSALQLVAQASHLM
jgi:hypothetical protein